ncbi:Jag N-terminal domain-containing protein, partial [Desulfovibrio sp. OttesenSCG-928-A18]|nr:Jag N-terminal domain-containing protein [Desulfovibrio sp. OttesenSCG-928-A18]
MQYKEFQGKSLDDAIREACEYYGVAREKLEIEIVSDAKSGIFGLVGAKKATIKAARVQLEGTVSSLLAGEPVPEKQGARSLAHNGPGGGAKAAESSAK